MPLAKAFWNDFFFFSIFPSSGYILILLSLLLFGLCTEAVATGLFCGVLLSCPGWSRTRSGESMAYLSITSSAINLVRLGPGASGWRLPSVEIDLQFWAHMLMMVGCQFWYDFSTLCTQNIPTISTCDFTTLYLQHQFAIFPQFTNVQLSKQCRRNIVANLTANEMRRHQQQPHSRGRYNGLFISWGVRERESVNDSYAELFDTWRVGQFEIEVSRSSESYDANLSLLFYA